MPPSTPFLCLLGFAGWTVLLVLALGAWRVQQVLAGRARPNAFPSDVPHGPEPYRRLIRAHANCVENLPVLAAVLLTAAVLGFDPPVLGTLSVVYLSARVMQSIAHVASGRSLAVNFRFAFFVTQLVCLVWMGVLVAQAAASM